MARSDLGHSHALTSAGRGRCAEVATRHGVYALAEAGCLPSCATCPDLVRERCVAASVEPRPAGCPVLGEFRAQLLEGFRGYLAPAGHLQPEDWPLVCEYAKTLTVLARIDQVLAVVGTESSVVEECAAKPQKPGEAYVRKQAGWCLRSLLVERQGWSSLAFRQAEALGLSPAGRLKLGLGGVGEGAKSAMLVEIAREKAAERPEGVRG